MSMSDHVDAVMAAAVAAAERGWPVFLLGRSKRPLANCPRCPKQRESGAHDPEACECLTCHGFYAATRDPGRIEAMVTAHPDGLLAVRTGAAPDGAGTVVVDIDPAHGGRLDHGLMTPTLATASGNHGWHLHYQHPGRPVLSRPMPGMVGVDVKADGGYVVLPPSVHPTTRRRYQWANTLGVEEMPPRLAEIVLAPPTAVAPTASVRTSQAPLAGNGGGSGGGVVVGPIRHPDRLVDSCLAAVRTAPEGRRRVTLYGAARGVARVILAGHLTHNTAVELLTEVGRAVEQTDRDIHAAITGGFTAEGL